MSSTVWTKAPNPVIAICITVVVVSLIGSFSFLIAMNKDPHGMLNVIQTILSFAGLIFGSGGLLYAGAAAKQADTAATAITNGVLQAKIQAAMTEALKVHESQAHPVGPPQTPSSS